MNINPQPFKDPTVDPLRLSSRKKTTNQPSRSATPLPNNSSSSYIPAPEPPSAAKFDFHEGLGYSPPCPEDRAMGTVYALRAFGVIAVLLGIYFAFQRSSGGTLSVVLDCLVGACCGLIICGFAFALGWALIFLNDISNTLERIRVKSDGDVVLALSRVFRSMQDNTEKLKNAIDGSSNKVPPI